MQKIRLRFAPSPTGYLHIGSLRIALFDYLTAKSKGGKLILRIEDTDQKRFVPGAAEKLIDILEWVGLKFDEGHRIGGNYGPYVQSQRREIYDKYKKELLNTGEVYYCFCTPERLEKMRADQQEKKLPPRYDRRCRDLSPEEIKRRIDAGEKYVIRQKMPLEGDIIVHDELRGDIKFKASELDDQVLIKSDGMPTYQFANVIDDHLMEISHIIRGEEWIPSLPKNILLYRIFDWEPPKFIHMPLTLNKGGGKLSKRQGDVAVEDYRAQGYLKEALINFSVLTGWHPKDDREIFTLAELEKVFKIEDMGTSPAVFDIEKLDYFNGYYIRQKPLDELAALCLPYLQENLNKTTDNRQQTTEYIKRVVGLEQERLKKLSEVGELTEFFFIDELIYPADLLIWKNLPAERIKNNLQEVFEQLEKIPEKNWTNNSIEDALMTHIKAKEAKAGDYLWPMRAALTSRQASPGPFDVAEVLEKKISLARIKNAIMLLK